MTLKEILPREQDLESGLNSILALESQQIQAFNPQRICYQFDFLSLQIKRVIALRRTQSLRDVLSRICDHNYGREISINQNLATVIHYI
jgi:hypothetical protein